MKQLLVILVLIALAVYVFQAGPENVLRQLKLDSYIQVNSLPGKASERRGVQPSEKSIDSVTRNVFDSFDPVASYYLVEIAYTSGWDNSEKIMDRYLSTVAHTQQDKNKVYNLIKNYKDKETLNMLIKHFIRGTFPRKETLRTISEMRDPAAVETVYLSLEDENIIIKSEAKEIIEDNKENLWFKQYAKDFKNGKRVTDGQHIKSLIKQN